jgi:hypothetical protein
MYFKHLITFIYKTQNNIYKVSKLFLNNFINLRRHHFIHSHIKIHYNYNNVRFLKIQSYPLQSFFSWTLFWYPNREWTHLNNNKKESTLN